MGPGLSDMLGRGRGWQSFPNLRPSFCDQYFPRPRILDGRPRAGTTVQRVGFIGELLASCLNCSWELLLTVPEE